MHLVFPLAALLAIAATATDTPSADPLPASSLLGDPAEADLSDPRACADMFCEAVRFGDADTAAACFATAAPLWTDMDGYRAFLDQHDLDMLSRPCRVSGEVGLGESRYRLWLTTTDDETPHTFGLILGRQPDSTWRIREVDGYDIADADPVEAANLLYAQVALADAEKERLLAEYDAAIEQGRHSDAFDAAVRLWQGGVMDFGRVVQTLAAWRREAERTGNWEGFEENAARLYAMASDDTRPVRWRMYPDRAYTFPLNVKATYHYHAQMAAAATARGDSDSALYHETRKMESILKAYGFARDRPAQVYLLDQAAASYRMLTRADPRALDPKERRYYQATLVRQARAVLPRVRGPRATASSGGQKRGKTGAAVSPAPRTRETSADVLRRLRDTARNLRQTSATRAAASGVGR